MKLMKLMKMKKKIDGWRDRHWLANDAMEGALKIGTVFAFFYVVYVILGWAGAI